VDHVGVEIDTVSLAHDRPVTERAAEHREALAQIVACLLVAHAAPQERGEMDARVTPTRGQGEVAQESLRLLALKIEDSAVADDPQGTQERDLQGDLRDRSRRAN
jgi:hypothetical protein